MKMLILLNLIVLLLFHPGCTKEELPAVNCHQAQEADCENFNTAGCNFVDNRSNSAAHTHPVFNPNDPDEFIFYEHSGKTSLVKFNMRTNEKTVLLEDVKYSTGPVWGRSGWIAYSSRDWKIWRLREDGSEHKQITNNPRDIFPAFSPAGDRIIHSRTMEYSNASLQNNPELRYQYKMMIIDLDGNEVDSICRPYEHNIGCSPWYHTIWYGENKILGGFGSYFQQIVGMGFYNFSGEVEDTIYSRPINQQYGMLSMASVNPYSKIYIITAAKTDYAGIGSIEVFNYITESFSFLRKACDSRRYGNISVSPDGKKLLADRNDSKLISDCTTESETYIVIMDADGCNERLVVISE